MIASPQITVWEPFRLSRVGKGGGSEKVELTAISNRLSVSAGSSVVISVGSVSSVDSICSIRSATPHVARESPGYVATAVPTFAVATGASSANSAP